jgi:hypothetical protein
VKAMEPEEFVNVLFVQSWVPVVTAWHVLRLRLEE